MIENHETVEGRQTRKPVLTVFFGDPALQLLFALNLKFAPIKSRQIKPRRKALKYVKPTSQAYMTQGGQGDAQYTD